MSQSALEEISNGVQQHWDDREFGEFLDRSIQLMEEFLANFQSVAKAKLEDLKERISRLDRRVGHLESCIAEK